MIERGEVYRHIKNLKVLQNIYKMYLFANNNDNANAKVDSFLTACLVLTFALVVGLGLGHFLGETTFVIMWSQSLCIAKVSLLLTNLVGRQGNFV